MAENDNTPDHSDQALARRVLEGEIVDGEVAGRVRVLTLRNVFTLEELAALTREPRTVGSSEPSRCLLVVVADEGEPRPGSGVSPLCVRELQLDAGCPVMYLDAELVIGRIEAPFVLPPDVLEVPTTGDILVATVRLQSSPLAALPWSAVKRGWFTGCCAEVRGDQITRVILGDIANSCLPNAPVIKGLEGDDAV
jgi:hypothetical protein